VFSVLSARGSCVFWGESINSIGGEFGHCLSCTYMRGGDNLESDYDAVVERSFFETERNFHNENLSV